MAFPKNRSERTIVSSDTVSESLTSPASANPHPGHRQTLLRLRNPYKSCVVRDRGGTGRRFPADCALHGPLSSGRCRAGSAFPWYVSKSGPAPGASATASCHMAVAFIDPAGERFPKTVSDFPDSLRRSGCRDKACQVLVPVRVSFMNCSVESLNSLPLRPSDRWMYPLRASTDPEPSVGRAISYFTGRR